ncbi:MAG: hypothetical protein PHH54_04190 [Candidatus Nanoarchaeia archaeon]|nr:hypothetical protein [Candidatus Nanoarchaeia archaeon]MDD5741160.1 hypothetical protein [Candidatus Nanoarchaeia archaeon]
MVNKKAQEMSVTAIILIVLGVFVLVVLILGFTIGWDKLKELIMPSNNIASIKDSCKIACATDQTYNYCSEKRELKSKEENLKDVTCYSLNKKKPVYGIEDCSVDCGIYDDLAEATAACAEEGEEMMYLDGVNVKSYVCKLGDISANSPMP